MTRRSFAGWYVVGLMLMTTGLVAQQPVYQSKPETITATIEAIDKANRVVTLKGPKGSSVDFKAPDQLEGFNSLKVGDEVTATYKAGILEVRYPYKVPTEAQPRKVTVTRS